MTEQTSTFAQPIKRIPLDIVVTATRERTGGMLVAVMGADLDALETENKRLNGRLIICRTALTLIAHDEGGFDRSRDQARKALIQ